MDDEITVWVYYSDNIDRAILECWQSYHSKRLNNGNKLPKPEHLVLSHVNQDEYNSSDQKAKELKLEVIYEKMMLKNHVGIRGYFGKENSVTHSNKDGQ